MWEVSRDKSVRVGERRVKVAENEDGSDAERERERERERFEGEVKVRVLVRAQRRGESYRGGESDELGAR